MPTSLFQFGRHSAVVALAFVFAAINSAGAAPASGAIEGRVLNATSGVYLNNARVALPGTGRETFTNESGEFRLDNVPAGEVRLAISFTGLESQTLTAIVPAGDSVRKEIELRRAVGAGEAAVVKLDAFIVTSQREENAGAIAAHEQRVAPNIKNVVAGDAFGDIAEGNLGEFVKFIPGVVVNYEGSMVKTISLRGLPSNTTAVLVDGNRFASASNSLTTRDVYIDALNMNNITRVEVSKTPTPDTPADSMGGSVNIVSKSAFERRKPLVSFKAYASMNSDPLTLGKPPGSMPENTTRRALPGMDFSYIAPISKTFGFTLTGLFLQRYSGTKLGTLQWRPTGAASAFGTPESPYLDTYLTQENPTKWERRSLGTTLDWRVGTRGVLSATATFTSLDFYQGIHSWTSSLTGTTSARPLAYDATFAESANGAGSATRNTNNRDIMDRALHLGAKYRYTGAAWKWDAGGFYSRSLNNFRDVDYGYFSSALVRVRNLNLRFDGLNSIRPGPATVVAKSVSGAPIELLSLEPYSLQTTGSVQKDGQDVIEGAQANAQRTFSAGLPLVVRMGFDTRRQDRDIRLSTPNWTFVGPDGVANTADDLATRYDVIDSVYSAANTPFSFAPMQRVSAYKLWQLYQQHPEYFRLDQAGMIQTNTAGSLKLVETVTAGYLRGDVRLFAQRLWLVGGVRYERTADDGYGPLNDVRATYRQDANGNLILDATGRPLRVTTDSVALARLQYRDRGSHVERSYGNLYPSFNATYHFTPSLQARLAFARTIGRPNLSEIIPTTSISDPSANETNRIITVVNTGLKPWTADNYDVSVEKYFDNAGRISIGAFRKDIKDFFGAVRTSATTEILAGYGLSDEYLDYDVVTKSNVGDAQVTGLEVEVHQPLTFLPAWARGVIVFVNGTKSHLEGNNAAVDFSGFTRESYNCGVSLSRPRYTAKLTWNYRGRQRLGVLTGTGVPPGDFNYNAPFQTLNVSADYRLSRQVALFATARNIFNRAARAERYSLSTPKYARLATYSSLGAQIVVGIKGAF